MARFRPDPTLLSELNQISGENDFYPLGQVPTEWFSARMMGVAAFWGEYAAVCENDWLNRLRADLGPRLLAEFGIHELDAANLLASPPRKLTQMVSRAVFNADLDGIRYPSKHGHEIENWALFEPFKIDVKRSDPIAFDDPDLKLALKLLRLAVA